VKVAYFSPLPPERSGIADYSALLLPALERLLDVSVVRRGARRLPRGTDVALYHIGNNPDAHGWIADVLRHRRGLVVLHDFVLHHLVAGMTLGRGDRAGYLDAMQREAGAVGRMLAHGVIDGVVPPLWEVRPHHFPLAKTILGEAQGLIVHSAYVEGLARTAGYRGPIWQVPHPAWEPPSGPPDESLVGPDFVVGCVGNLNPSKRVRELVGAFAMLRRACPEARLVLAGSVSQGVDVAGELARARLEEGVAVLPSLPEERLWSVLRACHVCVNLRWPTMGETSGIVIRALGLGLPTVVSDVGWFSELPDDVVAKVPVDAREQDLLAAVLLKLAEDEELRRSLGTRARDYIERVHARELVADRYAAALEETAGGEAVTGAVLGDVARAAHDVGIDPYGPELSEIGRSAREVGLGG
jgi:glycosyltransferase involved in cell wall biosynthesis